MTKPDRLKLLSFEEINYNTRVEFCRIWESIHEGSERIKINWHSLYKESLELIKSLNLRKELKVSFNDEYASDAGGVTKEWVREFFL